MQLLRIEAMIIKLTLVIPRMSCNYNIFCKLHMQEDKQNIKLSEFYGVGVDLGVDLKKIKERKKQTKLISTLVCWDVEDHFRNKIKIVTYLKHSRGNRFAGV